MKLKLSLQNVTTSKGEDQRKKNGNALVHNFVALSACAALAMIFILKLGTTFLNIILWTSFAIR